ncbi:hypothetical protein ACE1CI_25025 [Aerosakkonemataceae cyanobacterium BLCC-F50]|uniref:DUF4278 domain-containing protein n=1 Tax=Floridaenema flaviceps BLCC-F50 TaxID=3153642 RepID=A0ABV4XXK4_9CYAN
MQLIYRGHTYNYTPAAPKAYVKPRALNWRYQVAGETYEPTSESIKYVKPRAINWRYQMSLAI